MKSFKKFFSVLFVCILLSLTVCSDYISCYNVKASGGITDYIDNLTYYFLTITGAVNKPSSHPGSSHSEISPAPTTSRNAIRQKISDLINNNSIYESNGQYIFTSSAMDELYYILNDNSTPNYRVISDFSGFNVYGIDSYEQYVNYDFLSTVSSRLDLALQSTSNIIIDVYNYYNGSYYYTKCFIYKLNNNFAFLGSASNHLYFRDRNSDLISYSFDSVACTYTPSTSSYRVTYDYNRTYNYADVNLTYYSNYFSTFPRLVGLNGSYPVYNTFYCTNSLILANSIPAGTTAINKTDGIYYFNNYGDITIDNSVVNNNNWSSIYNSYVTNVSNTYNEEVTNNNGSDLTANQIRQIMNTYVQPIYNAIEDGLTDIAEKVNYINEWLSKIYTNGSLIITRLDNIIQIIQQNTGGSGSTSGTACAWSEQEVDIVLDKLSRIYTEQVDNDLDVIAALEYIKTKISSLDTTLTTASSNISTISSNTSSIVTSLDTELSRLATVLTKMDTIISKMGQNRITRPTVDPNIIDDLEDLLPESVLDDIFSPFAALGSIIETVVPFCYIGVAVAIMSNLSAEAEAPYWEIPFKYDSDALALHIDEKIVIDLSPFEDLSTILRLLFIIAFTISLMFFSLPLVNYMTGIFSGK